MKTDPEVLFRKRLAEAATWCESRIAVGDPEHSLRSEDLKPTLLEDDGSLRRLWLRPEHIQDVVLRREYLLSSAQRSPSVPKVGAGRLLAAAYEYTNHNDASADETGYFFDENDVPPWDTWVAEIQGVGGEPVPSREDKTWPPTLRSWMGGPLNRGVLIAWIPRPFVALAGKGIETECMGMLGWLDEPSRSVGGAPRFENVLPRWLVRAAQELVA